MIHLGVNSKPENCDNIDRENILKEKNIYEYSMKKQDLLNFEWIQNTISLL